MFSAPRGWFLFIYFGRANVKILDGGLSKWKREDLLTDKTPTEPLENITNPHKYDYAKKKHFVATYTDIVNYSRIGESPEDRSIDVVDGRLSSWFYGASGPCAIPGGSVPNSLNLYYKDLLTSTGEFKSSDDLETRYIAVGLDTVNDKVSIAMCDSGVSACIILAAYSILNVHRWKLYDGSWMEYQNR
jgi:thiosulfate/3-mercaptopyruvate sulfurtransferase